MEKTTEGSVVAAYVNAKLYTPAGVVRNGTMIVGEDGTIEETGGPELAIPASMRRVDAEGLSILPGLIDIHVHGGGGFQLMDATYKSLDGMSRFHASRGTTSFLATTSTDSNERIEDALRAAAGSAKIGLSGAELAGVHLEGPFLNPKRAGAQNKQYLRAPDTRDLERWASLSEGMLRLVTIAPELEGGTEVVKWLADRGITVSVGHSDATFEQVLEAVSSGVRQTTHHFNGMSPLHHREPGVVGAGLVSADLTVELIADGVHVHPAVCKLIFNIKGSANIVLVTDAVMCAGLPDGDYGRRKMIGGLVYLYDGSCLSGSSLSTLQALRNMVKFTGLPLESVLPSLTEVPARQVGLSGRKGSLTTKRDADFLIVDENLELIATYVKGRRVHHEQGGC